ncbi:MAG: MmcB family DNA repair protein [Hyphomicrobiales bacterium]|nr:MmcB family DNA repair protein [Hyphomicrobiales bacterium]
MAGLALARRAAPAKGAGRVLVNRAPARVSALTGGGRWREPPREGREQRSGSRYGRKLGYSLGKFRCPDVRPMLANPKSVRSMTPAPLRGAMRLLRAHYFAALTEFPLKSGRRADILGLGPQGEIWIVEVKSSVADFRADRKWTEYRDWCDRLFFAVGPEFPHSIIPEDTGLIIADAYDAALIREAPETSLAPARRRALTLRFARLAAVRLYGQNLEPWETAEV